MSADFDPTYGIKALLDDTRARVAESLGITESVVAAKAHIKSIAASVTPLDAGWIENIEIPLAPEVYTRQAIVELIEITRQGQVEAQQARAEAKRLGNISIGVIVATPLVYALLGTLLAAILALSVFTGYAFRAAIRVGRGDQPEASSDE